MNLLGRFLCWIGIHNWEHGLRGYLTSQEAIKYRYVKACVRPDCGLWGVTHNDRWEFVRPHHGLVEGQPVAAPDVKVDRIDRYVKAYKALHACNDPSMMDSLRDAFDSARCDMSREEQSKAAEILAVDDPSMPAIILFLPDGLSFVRDQRGQPMPHLQRLEHSETIEAVKKTGVDYDKVQKIGRPIDKPKEKADGDGPIRRDESA